QWGCCFAINGFSCFAVNGAAVSLMPMLLPKFMLARDYCKKGVTLQKNGFSLARKLTLLLLSWMHLLLGSIYYCCLLP
ncbi:hypothetical protein U1Q18_037355, partial [Sarracenia purpurea var. burkii]